MNAPDLLAFIDANEQQITGWLHPSCGKLVLVDLPRAPQTLLETCPNAVTSAASFGNVGRPASDGWNGWGVDLAQHRFQPAAMAQLKADEVPRLKLKWAFGFPGDTRAYAQPAIVGGRLFVGSAGGKVYSLDAKSGCVHWIFDAGFSVRTAVTIGGSARGAAAKAPLA
jgi:glucose dehydrogenase